MKLLHVDSSILGEHSVSRGISAAAVARLAALHPGIEVTHLDLAADPVPQQSGALLAAQATAPEEQSPEVREALVVLATRLDEFLAADIVVIGAPMYNFGIPSQLKAWIDALAIRGKTFRYTETGPEGLAGGKRVVIAAAKGGFYGEGSPVAAYDHTETYLKAVFGFLGITDIEFVRAEGIAVSAEQKQTSMNAALAEAGALRAA